MRHVRKIVFPLLVLMSLCCFHASAWAVFQFPSSLREIGAGAFEGVELPPNYAIRPGVEKIGSRAFAGTGIEVLYLPSSVKEMAPDAIDEGTAIACSPGTYAESWSETYGFDYDMIKPFLSASSTALLYGESTVLTADYVFASEPTSYVWESRGRERYWSVIPGETGPTLHYTNTDPEGYIYFRVTAIVGDESSAPSGALCVRRYAGTLGFLADQCRALDGQMVYLEWNFLGKDANYTLFQWIPDEQHPEGGDWQAIDQFKGGWNRTVYGLDRKTTYQFRLGLSDNEGNEIYSDPITLTTGEKPTSLEMLEYWVDGTSVKMSWVPIHGAVYDVFLGDEKDAMSLFISGRKSAKCELYSVKRKKYAQVRARIPNTGYEYLGPILEINPNGDGPYVEIDDYEVHGDVVNLRWTPLSGCYYDVYQSINGGEEICIAESTLKNYLDVGGLIPGEKRSFRVRARCGYFSTISPELEIEVPKLNDVAYRALLIGEVNFKGTMYASRNYGDVELITEMLENVKTPDGTYYSIVRAQDLGSDGILSMIAGTFANADEKDVSLLFIATHGDVAQLGRYAGALSTVEVPGKKHGRLLIEDLTSALTKIKGTKIVWLGSCGSGSAIYDPEEENSSDGYFGDYDEDEWEGWPEYEMNEAGDDASLPDDALVSICEMRLPDFQVMTAARYRYVSWGLANRQYNHFTRLLVEGVYGPGESMPADSNGDGKITQKELFTYIKMREEDPELGVDQDVQAYPYDSEYVLFSK